MKPSVRRPVYAAVCLALCMILPLFTGQLQSIGKALNPMHLPVLLAGFVCGPQWALAVGAVAPLLRFALFGMPSVWPTGISMMFELATYGVVCGLMYRVLPPKPWRPWACLLPAMVAGRVVWGLVRALISFAGGIDFTWELFLAGAFVNALPGIVTQLVLIPAIVFALEKANKTK